MQMHRRCSFVDVEGIAILPHHRLAFGGHSARWNGAVATVLPDSGSHVPGVLYRLTGHALEALDRFEGHPFVYARAPVRVFAQGKRWQDAETYVLRHFVSGRPAAAYVDIIRRSYRVWGFDELDSFSQMLEETTS